MKLDLMKPRHKNNRIELKQVLNQTVMTTFAATLSIDIGFSYPCKQPTVLLWNEKHTIVKYICIQLAQKYAVC